MGIEEVGERKREEEKKVGKETSRYGGD